MAKRQRNWARKTRNRLMNLLGNKCKRCGSTKNLQFDCIIPKGDSHHAPMEWSWRMSFYRHQLTTNNLQILCEKCQTKKSVGEQFHQETAALKACGMI